MTKVRLFKARLFLVSGLLCSFGGQAAAQHWISVGITGGIPLTNSFEDRTTSEFMGVTTGSAANYFITVPIHTYSDSRNFLIGPTIELRPILGLSVEADALYHPINVSTQTGVPSLTTGTPGSVVARPSVPSHTNTWEFPVVAKYRLPLPVVKPYVEARPTFRALSSLGTYLSTYGFTAGAGVEAKAWKVRLAPELRYVHWGADSAIASPYYASARNEAQFLVGISY